MGGSWMKYNLLVVDDEDSIRLTLSEALKARYGVAQASSAEEAKLLLRDGSFDMVLTDLRLGKLGGMDVLKEAKGLNPRCSVIILTAYGSIDNAVEAMKAGADDYLTKPFRLEELEHKVALLLQRQRAAEELEYLRSELAGDGALIGSSEPFRELKREVLRAAAAASNVLILGETGSGKEMLARALHAASERAGQAFVALNCSAFDPGFIESELFGHEKGSASNAHSLRRGRLEMADGGTLFLDEVADLPAEAQLKLLRVLELKTFERVGGKVPLQSDFRLVSATHRNLEAMVAEGSFREDLYFRLNAFPLRIPPLRERGEDCLELAAYFLAKKPRGRELKLPEHAERILKSYPWPGNVRELQNVIERAVLLSDGHILRLDLALTDKKDLGVIPRSPLQSGKNLSELLDDAEKSLVSDALRKAEGNQTQAAKLLGLERSTLQYKIKKHHLG
jgi:two-component system NtrC family response regulator